MGHADRLVAKGVVSSAARGSRRILQRSKLKQRNQSWTGGRSSRRRKASKKVMKPGRNVEASRTRERLQTLILWIRLI